MSGRKNIAWCMFIVARSGTTTACRGRNNNEHYNHPFRGDAKLYVGGTGIGIKPKDLFMWA